MNLLWEIILVLVGLCLLFGASTGTTPTDVHEDTEDTEDDGSEDDSHWNDVRPQQAAPDADPRSLSDEEFAAIRTAAGASVPRRSPLTTDKAAMHALATYLLTEAANADIAEPDYVSDELLCGLARVIGVAEATASALRCYGNGPAAAFCARTASLLEREVALLLQIDNSYSDSDDDRTVACATVRMGSILRGTATAMLSPTFTGLSATAPYEAPEGAALNWRGLVGETVADDNGHVSVRLAGVAEASTRLVEAGETVEDAFRHLVDTYVLSADPVI